MTAKNKNGAWKKVLYINHGYPDNYTDESFLDEMKKNVNTRMYDFRSVVFESGIVSQQLATICIFVSTFIYLDSNTIQPTTLLLIIFILFLLGIIFRNIISKVRTDITSFYTVSALLFALSPILKTLTKTISTDTIYAMTTCMLVANMLFHDYGAGVAIVSRAISLNASMFAAVCLASRLPSSWHVYVYVMFAVQMFALFPEFRKDVKFWHRKAYVILTEVLVGIATFLLLPISQISAFALVFMHIAITFLFPLWMIKLQQLKNNIHGPWDEAMIRR